LFEIGGLVAFDEILGSVQPSNGFDIYVGASAGSVVASLLGLGLPARELWQTVLGESSMLPPIRPQDVFRIESPYRIFRAAVRHSLRALRGLRKRGVPVNPATLLLALREDLPAGLLSIEPLRETITEIFRRLGRSERFSSLTPELYIPAFELDTGARVVFGAPRARDVPIPLAVAASSAIPGLFAPVAIHDSLFIDGGVGQLTHADIALGAGAQTLVVFNPFVPIENDRSEVCFTGLDGSCVTLGEKGFFYVVEQARRVSRAAKLKLETRSVPSEGTTDRLFVVQPEAREAIAFLQSPVSDRWKLESLELGSRTARRFFEAHGAELAIALRGTVPATPTATVRPRVDGPPVHILTSRYED
jgi:predicted acylesterase/phospholipase RssA